jgi:hypothetical protein
MSPLQAVERRQLRQKHSKSVLPPTFNAFMQAAQDLIADIRHIMHGTQFKPNRSGTVRYLRRERRLIDVHANADYNIVAIAFTEYPAYLAPIYQHIIRPLDLHIGSPGAVAMGGEHSADRLRHRKPSDKRKRNRLMRRNIRDIHNCGHHKIFARGRKPSMVKPTASRSLHIRNKDIARLTAERVLVSGFSYGFVQYPPIHA